MNIYTLRDNLKRTIERKQEVYDVLRERKHIPRAELDQMAVSATINFLEVNLQELREILAGVEVCCGQATEASWAANPDRSGA